MFTLLLTFMFTVGGIVIPTPRAAAHSPDGRTDRHINLAVSLGRTDRHIHLAVSLEIQIPVFFNQGRMWLGCRQSFLI